MPTFAVTVEDAEYEVEAPDENTAWKWANKQHALDLDYAGVGAQKTDRPPAEKRGLPLGIEAFPEAMRAEMHAQPWLTRQYVGAGTALGNIIERAKQITGNEDRAGILANRVMAQEAPLGAVAGNAAMYALPTRYLPGANTVTGAGAMGAFAGATQPTDEPLDTLRNTAAGAAFSMGGQAIGNELGAIARDRAAGRAAFERANADRIKTLADARGVGLVVPPASVNPSLKNRLIESISGKISTAQLAATKNQQIGNRLSRAVVGLPEDAPLTSEAMQAIRRQAYQAGYEPVASAGKIQTDKAFTEALDRIVDQYEGAARSFPGAIRNDVSNLVNGILKGEQPARSMFVDVAGQEVKGITIPTAPVTRNLLTEIKKAGGISTREISELGIDPKAATRDYPGLFRKDGMTADRLTEIIEQGGWRTGQQLREADQFDPGGAPGLVRDMVSSALRKEQVIHPVDADAMWNYNRALQELDDAGIRQVTMPKIAGESAGGYRVGEFDAGDAIKAVQILRDDAAAAFRKGDTGIAKAQKDLAKSIEDQIERGLFAKGEDGRELLKGFRSARTLMAKAHTVEDAIIEGSNDVNLRKYAARVQAGKPMSEELDVLGRFANLFPRATQPPTQVAGPDVNNLRAWLGMLTAGGGGAGGATLGGMPGAALGGLLGAAVPIAAQTAARSYLFSPGTQANLLKQGASFVERLGSPNMQMALPPAALGLGLGLSSYGAQ